MTVVATGTHVAHCHAAEAGHAHGFGWASVGSAGGGLPHAHRHFILCGIELGAEDSCETPDGVRPVLAADSLPAPDNDSAELAVPLVDLLTGSGIGLLAPVTEHSEPPRMPLCAPAVHIKSTVLRL